MTFSICNALLAQTNTPWSTSNAIGIGTANPETNLDVTGDFVLRGTYGTLMRSGLFGTSTNHSHSTNKWIKLGVITLNGNWNDANLTLDFYPWNAKHGDSRQQVNISIRNGSSGIEGSYDINLITFYGRQKSIKDVKLVHTSGSGISNNQVSIWIQMGSSHVYNVPFKAYYHGNVSLVYNNQPFHNSINETGTTYDVNSRYGMYGTQFEVEGTIRSKEVKVEAANWPDYVFAEEYELRSLEETESFIRTHHRLPDMPSAEQVEEEGIELGEMNRLLLEKVEELTLHVIGLEKKNGQLELQLTKGQELKANGQLKEKVKSLIRHQIEQDQKIENQDKIIQMLVERLDKMSDI
ncbi:MAG: hypothetical protein KI790_11010 [Cyclobacteriaceae bacterium]|nr:hypothetical protein [Cyclobacteriaceae bacterium HetDA_MAG_MS6]